MAIGAKTQASSAGGTYMFYGTLAVRPAAGVLNRYYWATDIFVLFRDTGAAWEVESVRPYAREIWTENAKFTVAAWNTLTANMIYYSPIQIPWTMTLDGIGVSHGAVGAGNLYVAIYKSAGDQPTNRLWASASTGVTGVSQKQVIPIAATLQVVGGLYFIALEADNALDNYLHMHTDRLARPGNVNHGLSYYSENLGGYIAPPAVATPAFELNYAKQFVEFVRVLSVP